MAKLKLNRWGIFKELTRYIIHSDHRLLFRIRMIMRLPFMVARLNPIITFEKKKRTDQAVQIQIEENQKLRKENLKLKRSLVRKQLTNAWSLKPCPFKEVKLFELDYWVLELSGITRLEADQLVAEIQEKFKEDE